MLREISTFSSLFFAIVILLIISCSRQPKILLSAEHGFRHVRFSHDTALLLQRGHIRLRVWIGEENDDSHGARLNWLIARSSEACMHQALFGTT